MEVFKWVPMIESASKHNYTPRIVSFGDSYEQRQKGSIHTDLRTYESQVFRGKKSYVEEISEFVVRHAGVKAFLWHAHDRKQQRKYRTEGEPVVKFITGDIWDITITIKEVVA